MSSESPFERALPHSAEAERAILGAILLDNGLIAQAVAMLKPEMFYVPSHKRIFEAMVFLFQRGSEINSILVGEEIRKQNALESVGGFAFITNLTYGLPHSTSIEHYAKVVFGKAMLRDLVRASNAIIQEALEEEDEPEVVMDHAEGRIFSLRSEHMHGAVEPVTPIADRIMTRIQEAEGKEGTIHGLTSGFRDLDKLLGGFKKQDLIIVAARPSMGKTSLALMLAINAAINAEAVVVIYSLEMSKEALVQRLLCGNANIDSKRFDQGFLSRLEWGQIAKSLGILSDARIFLDDTPGMSTTEMRAKSMRLKTEQKRLDLIIVDYLQLATGTKKRYESRQQEVSDVARELKNTAKKLDVPLIALAQLSRAPETRSEHKPMLSDLRESGELEQASDVVSFIYRPDQYKKKEEVTDEERNVAELIIGKNRNGPTGSIELRFTPSSMRFDNLYSLEM